MGAALRRQAAVVRLISRGPATQECVVCYEMTGEGTLCCGQPLCSNCAGSLSCGKSSCPVCREPLQHRGAVKARLAQPGVAPGSRQVPRVLRSERVAVAVPSGATSSVDLPAGKGAFGDYVESAVQQVELLRGRVL